MTNPSDRTQGFQFLNPTLRPGFTLFGQLHNKNGTNLVGFFGDFTNPLILFPRMTSFFLQRQPLLGIPLVQPLHGAVRTTFGT